jgi:hypothetical protein
MAGSLRELASSCPPVPYILPYIPPFLIFLQFLMPWLMPCPSSPRARCQALAPLAGSLRELDVNSDGMPSDALIHAGLLTGLTHLELNGDRVFGPGGPEL